MPRTGWFSDVVHWSALILSTVVEFKVNAVISVSVSNLF